MTSNVYLWIITGKVIGNATIDNPDFKLIESKIGIKLPTGNGIYQKSSPFFHERYLKVETCFNWDENYAGQVVHGVQCQTL
ncbi:unnamed protein product, partial [Mesorhabditis belari]|uniref:Uncharacterized protein n=1 Tax=Mesorhabditis belari TaxID=2138241 RepID=A0AAF3FNP5_9BILA